LNPVTEEIIWEYLSEGFYSGSRGAAYEQENGNILITESDKGHVFEITRKGEIVWDWWNPSFNEKGERAVLYRMTRFSSEELEKYIE